MSEEDTNSPKKLNLSPASSPRSDNNQQVMSQNSSVSSWGMSPESSCVSSEPDDSTSMQYPSSPEETPMLLVGCPRCLMYVMLLEVDPKCPRCKSTVLLDFLGQENAKKAKN